MATKVLDIDGDRTVTLDAGDIHRPGSLYLFGANGLAIEFDKTAFFAALRLEMGLISVDETIELLLDTQATTPQ